MIETFAPCTVSTPNHVVIRVSVVLYPRPVSCSRGGGEAAAGNRGERVGGARTMASNAAATTCSEAATSRQKELYGQLCEKLKEVERLGSVEALLSWDEQVNLPSFFSTNMSK